MNDLIEAVKAHAISNYNAGGWDVIIECWEDKDIGDHLYEHGATTLDQALRAFADIVDVYAEREADADFYRDEEY